MRSSGGKRFVVRGGEAGKGRKTGFALIVTITLLAFLVLLLVSLTALTRVETSVAANTRATQRAREHALMALRIAVGQLQAHAGPDSRLTAQANLLAANVANPWFTGVWTADDEGEPTLRAWLVSGNETRPVQFGPETDLGRETEQPELPLTFDPEGLATNGPESATPNRVRLVGPGSATTTGGALSHGGVVAPGVPLNVTPPGFASEKTIGRYAWWVGDEGVKASLALADREDEVRYAPWDTTGQRRRIRQQIATTPTFFRRMGGADDYGFDPLTPDNAPLLTRVLGREHVELLAPAATTAPLGAFRREYFHVFTGRTLGVLANTLPLASPHRGLLRDLSLAPESLGPAFAAQCDLARHLETPGAANTAVPPITTADSERRRHRMTPPVVSAATADDPAIEFKIAPVLNSFLIQFRVERVAGGAVEIRARMLVELWNPYSAALAPEDLVLEVTGLPRIRITDTQGGGAHADVELQAPPEFLGNDDPQRPLVVNLPFVSNGNTDRASWLPGRLYAWRTNTGATSRDLLFYDKTVGPSWSYATVPLGATHDSLRVDCPDAAVLDVRLKRADGTTLASYASPRYDAFSVENVEAPAADGNWKFGFGFRLRQPSALNRERDWLTTAGRDFRRTAPPAESYDAFNELLGLSPDLYAGAVKTAADIQHFAVFRAFGTARNSTRSANLDLPVFELPRLPYLSVGELQHLTLPELRPFAAGNSWGGAANTWFDRFFFSGLAAGGGGPDLAAGEPLPNWNLQPLTTTVAEAGAWSSRHLMQAGVFNVNSALPEAWRAMLSGVRFGAERAFRRADIDNSSAPTVYTGSQPGAEEMALATGAPATIEEVFNDTTLDGGANATTNPVGGPAFFRFPQTAQETYFWANTPIESAFKKQAFRQGVRGGCDAIDGSTLHTLTTEMVARLADAIVARVRERVAARGPFASMADFLAPNAAWGARNVLEAAIADAGINPPEISPPDADGTVADVAHFGLTSLTLTSGDIMTALAPYLRTRSDTFVVRAYGEALNPANQTVEGRAWCEAVVQRLPTLADADDPNLAAPAAGGFGREFGIVQFRWLAPSDI